MARFLFVVCLSLAVISLGCRRAAPVAEPPADSGAEIAQPAPTEAQPDTGVVEVDQSPPPGETAPETEGAPETQTAGSSNMDAKYTDAQIAAARQMAADQGVVLKEDAEGNVILVDTAAKRSWVDDYQMQEILVFPRLQTLVVEGPSITDQLAPKIAEAEGLTSLSMFNTLINDAGIAQLSGLKSLKAIDLRVSPLITDQAMETLAAMPELRAVRLSGVNVTDAGIETLLSLPRLSELDIRNCRGVTKKGIEQIGHKKSLRVLKIGGPKVDDEILGLVAGMDNLTGLSLDNCSITDAGVASLGRLPLEDLTVFQCANITDEGLNVLASYDRLQRLTLRDVGAKGISLA
ncbi:MAG: hypothetical protein JJ992_16315, partial [Planctomycetes bacterium]|nr:hypothetical protein [Planctomycetota bacterium]